MDNMNKKKNINLENLEDFKKNIDNVIDSLNKSVDFDLPVATTETLGGVKVDGITITVDDSGVISVSDSGNSSGGDINPPSPVLSDCSLDQIQSAARKGMAANYWSVGDKIPIELLGSFSDYTLSPKLEGVYYAFIIGFNHNSSIEGNNTIHFQFGKNEDGVDIAFVDKYYGMNVAGTQGYSDYRKKGILVYNVDEIACVGFLSCMPGNWQNAIVLSNKYNQGNYGSPNLYNKYSKKIWLLSEYELNGEEILPGLCSSNQVQEQYDYYKNGNSRIKYKHDNPKSACKWLLRNANYPGVVNEQGEITNVGSAVDSGTSYGFAPCFIIA